MKPTILLVDDHRILREGLRSLLEQFELATVIGQAGDGAEAVRMAGELKPDLVMMDMTMPVMNGIDATREIIKNNPAIKILVLSMESDRYFVVEALKAGATGYMLKDSMVAELEEAISIVASGGTYLPQKISTLLVKEYLQRAPNNQAVVREVLAPRQLEILQLVANGKCTKEIAWALQISAKTVENQRNTIMQKLQLFSIAELTKYSVCHGISSLT